MAHPLIPAIRVTFLLVIIASSVAHAGGLPDCFSIETAVSGLDLPVDMAFDDSGRIFVAEKAGVVRIVDNGTVLGQPFIDLRDEVNNVHDRGLLGIALDPDFDTQPWVYLLYVVEPDPDDPDTTGSIPTFGRLVRYRGDNATGGLTADLSSRQVLIGDTPADGFIHCFRTHAVGALRFGHDGSLFVSLGDGAHFVFVDAGMETPDCFDPSLFDPIHDIGAFRAQNLTSLAGKILRIDPVTGQGLPSNPFWTGNADDVASKTWAYGFRNPFRFTIKPDSPSPGTLLIADVGWHDFEELNVATGGENFGWPCYEGPTQQPEYFDAEPTSAACDTIGSPDNPGLLSWPIAWWHRNNGNLSQPFGLEGRSATGGVFYTHDAYPPRYRGALFFTDYVRDWVAVMQLGERNEMVTAELFYDNLNSPVDAETHPITGDVHIVSIADGDIFRIVYEPPAMDSDRDCDIDLADFAILQRCFGLTPSSDAMCATFDTDADDDVDLNDYAAFRDQFTGPS